MNDIEKQSIGEAIYNSVRLISKVGAEIEALATIMKNEVDQAIADGSLGDNIKIIEKWESDCWYDDNDWVVYHYKFWIGISPKNRRSKAERYLYIEFTLDPETAYEGELICKEPSIEISLWDEVFDGAEDCDLQAQVLRNFAPDARRWTDQCWIYSIYLTSVNNVHDVKRKIIEPIAKLLKNNDPVAAGLTRLDGVVHYEKKQMDGETKYIALGRQPTP
ncbi:hypothetical protein SAMN05421693_11274 [Ectothiorhodospira magna]|uniref:Uncharacterized protein n=1 Tax=Ectothiorhodospira magna TaxID=867345 RepID=A0A1H9C751_9GAMM|nr:hypothetical protein [Ectothiorhodospira magna]SEP96821.1 hypothetical protein SAMN05421693_11274 [Ectothiorhodospira magna]